MSAHEPASADTLGHRVQRLRSELEEEKVPLVRREVFPGAMHADWSRALDVLCEEIVYARYVSVHEGYRPSYGCFIVPDLSAIDTDSAIILTSLRESNTGGTITGDPAADADGAPSSSDATGKPADADLASDLRLLVDGEHTFLVRDLLGRTAFGTTDSPSDDLSLLNLCRGVAGVCVQRQRDGRVQMLMEGIVCINDGYDWRWLVTARELLPSVVESLDPPPDLTEELARHLGEALDLCVHVLSPRGIGATLVWRIGSQGPVGSVSNVPNSLPTELNLFSTRDRFAIVALLASVDGACFVERDGRIANYWAMLDPSSEAKLLVAEQGGTRHTSAKRYSYDEPRSIVIVVSADGPVTLFSDGAMLARLADTQQSQERTWLTRLPLAQGAQVSSNIESFECPKCAKQIAVEVDTHPDADASRIVRCPVCAVTELGTYENVLRLIVRVTKDWTPTPTG